MRGAALAWVGLVAVVQLAGAGSAQGEGANASPDNATDESTPPVEPGPARVPWIGFAFGVAFFAGAIVFARLE